MAKLIYSAIMSLDGYMADKHGDCDWAMGMVYLHYRSAKGQAARHALAD